MTHDELVKKCEQDARSLAESVHAAADAGVPYVVLLPALITVFREMGMMPDGMAIPGLPE